MAKLASYVSNNAHLEQLDPGEGKYIDGLNDAERLKCPSLLIMGDRDRLTPTRASKKVVEVLSDARIAILPGAGHALLSERPDPVLDELIKIV